MFTFFEQTRILNRNNRAITQPAACIAPMRPNLQCGDPSFIYGQPTLWAVANKTGTIILFSGKLQCSEAWSSEGPTKHWNIADCLPDIRNLDALVQAAKCDIMALSVLTLNQTTSHQQWKCIQSTIRLTIVLWSAACHSLWSLTHLNVM